MGKQQKTRKFSSWIVRNVRLMSCIAFSFALFIGIALTYYFLPILLNYGPGTINTEFDLEMSSGLSYLMQYSLIYIVLTIIGSIFILWQTKDFKHLQFLKDNLNTDDDKIKKQLNKIAIKCMRLPTYIFAIISILPLITLSTAFILLGFTSYADFKVILVMLTTSLFCASISIIFFKEIFKSVLIYLKNDVLDKSKITLSKTLIFQIGSLLLVGVLYTFLLSSSTSMEEKSAILKEHYTDEFNSIMQYNAPTSIEELKNQLINMEYMSSNDTAFIIDDNNEFINFMNVDVSDFFIKYALELSAQNDNRVYDYYGTESQGVIIPIKIGNENLKVIIKYDLTSSSLASVYINLLIVAICFGIFTYLISRSVSKEIERVAKNMNDISSYNKDLMNENLPITSNDEIGDLIYSFNKIQNLTRENIDQIENGQQMLLERERLASLGQMIGGIAHNLKTPIMSVAGAAEGLTELVSEYIASIDNPIVTKEDHKDIAKDMLDWITKIKTHTAYMSDIITTVKGQASQLSTTDYSSFTVYDLAKRVDILTKHEIKHALLTLETTINCDPSQTLHGDINNLIQVIVNLVSNSVQAYNGKPEQKILFTIDADAENVYLLVKDFGCGINKETQEKLFKEMVTTKGKNGTGLGLYMSYSTIRGKFGGNLSFISEVDKGTTFTITLPKDQKSN